MRKQILSSSERELLKEYLAGRPASGLDKEFVTEIESAYPLLKYDYNLLTEVLKHRGSELVPRRRPNEGYGVEMKKLS